METRSSTATEYGGRKGSFRNLKVWAKACDLAELTYGLTGEYPRSETYGLVSQMRRAAVSIPANIAEGCARRGTPEFLQFLHIAAGSLAELETFLELGKRLKLGSSEYYPQCEQLTLEIGPMLYALISSIRNRGSRS